MSYVQYLSSDVVMGWRPEQAFRDADGDGIQDESNLATDTFYPLPMFIGSDKVPYVVKIYEISKFYGAGSRLWSRIDRKAIKEMKTTLSGPLIDFTMLKWIFGECTGFNPYVHNSSNAIHNPPYSFEVWVKIPNDNSGETYYQLWQGCIVTGIRIKDTINDLIEIEMDISIANIVNGTALTTEPSYRNVEVFNSEHCSITYTKGGNAYHFYPTSITFEYKTNRDFVKSSCAYLPVSTKAASRTEYNLNIEYEKLEKATTDDTQDDPHTAQDKDLVFTLQRSASDKIEITFSNAFVDLDDESWSNDVLTGKIIATYNPHESGSAVTVSVTSPVSSSQFL